MDPSMNGLDFKSLHTPTLISAPDEDGLARGLAAKKPLGGSPLSCSQLTVVSGQAGAAKTQHHWSVNRLLKWMFEPEKPKQLCCYREKVLEDPCCYDWRM